MQYARIFADQQGETHFEDLPLDAVPVDVLPGREPVFLSKTQPAVGLSFMRLPAGWRSGSGTTAPQRNVFVTLNGELEIRASDGELRRFGTGDVLLAEDTTGAGHETCCLDRDWCALVIGLPPARARER